ncbi:uncharacterized protein LOC144098324 [Amblyomma americanum]
MYADLEDTIDVSSQRVATTPVHKVSRRLRGLQPEFGQLTTLARAMTSTTASQTTQHSGNAPLFVLHASRSPPSFHALRPGGVMQRIQRMPQHDHGSCRRGTQRRNSGGGSDDACGGVEGSYGKSSLPRTPERGS